MSINPYNPYGGQTAYSINTTNAFQGMLADISNKVVRSYAALEALGFGLAVVQAQGAAGSCRLPMINSVVLTESAPLVAANVINGNVNVTTVVNGARVTTTTPIAPVTYATSDAVTLTALAAAIAVITGVKTATAGASNVTVVANNDTEVTLSGFVTTAGAGQNTWSSVNASTDTFIGVSLFAQTIENSLSLGTAIYPLGDSVNVLTQGRVFVTAEAAVAGPADPVFYRFQLGATGTVRGGFRNTSDAAKCNQLTRLRWLEAIGAGAVGVLEVSLP